MSEPKTILVADDEAMARLNLQVFLEHLGYRVLTAPDGRAALALCEREHPDLVLTDLRMPGMDGTELIRALRQRGDETPIIVVSGTGTLNDAIAAVRQGAQDYVTKPVLEPSDIEFAVRRALEHAALLAANRRYQAQREDLLRELEAANQELENFAFAASHDLRAPLRRISGWGQVLAEECGSTLNAAGSQALAIIRAEAARLSQLVEALLGLARLTRGELKWAPVDLSALARAAADELRAADPGRPARFTIGADLHAHGDAVLLRAVLDNLLRNAWKFTVRRAQAEIEFNAGIRGGERIFFVRDNGVGFDPGRAERLFAPFQTLHDPADYPGNGIGLATVRRIVQRHGGRVWAEGAPEQGATFYFTLADH